MIGFCIWLIVSFLFIGFGISAFLSKKATGFWANVEMFPVTNVKAYNRAVGILFCIYGIILAFLGLPLLGEQNSPYIIISILGVMIETIVIMIIYVMVIEKKYRKRG